MSVTVVHDTSRRIRTAVDGVNRLADDQLDFWLHDDHPPDLKDRQTNNGKENNLRLEYFDLMESGQCVHR